MIEISMSKSGSVVSYLDLINTRASGQLRPLQGHSCSSLSHSYSL